jgi:hypothetical protein
MRKIKMKKLLGAAAVCALAIGLVAVPGALGVKSPKQVASSVSVSVTPNPVVAGAAATGSGNVSSNSGCRKDRRVDLVWVNTTTLAETVAGSATTRSNGDYTANLTAPATAGTYTLKATVFGPVIRKVGSKKKGKKTKKGRAFSCNASPPTSSSLVVVTPVI